MMINVWQNKATGEELTLFSSWGKTDALAKEGNSC